MKIIIYIIRIHIIINLIMDTIIKELVNLDKDTLDNYLKIIKLIKNGSIIIDDKITMIRKLKLLMEQFNQEISVNKNNCSISVSYKQDIIEKMNEIISLTDEKFYLIGQMPISNINNKIRFIYLPFKILTEDEILKICPNPELLVLNNSDEDILEYNNMLEFPEIKYIDREGSNPSNILVNFYNKVNLVNPILYRKCLEKKILDKLFDQ